MIDTPDRKDDAGIEDVTVTFPRAWLERALGADLNLGAADPVQLAQRILDDRDARRALFPGVRLGEPSWDMMLHLFVADHRREARSVSDMCVAANVPTTTALSHLSRLVREGYMARRRDRTDRRRTFISATGKLRTTIHHWLVLHGAWPSELIQ